MQTNHADEHHHDLHSHAHEHGHSHSHECGGCSHTDSHDGSEEQQALERIISAILTYKVDALWEVQRWEQNYAKLSARHKAVVPEQPAKHKQARQCVQTNQHFLKALISAAELDGIPRPGQDAQARTSPNDVEKVRYLLKNLVRDWAKEGAPERSQSYRKICQELKARFSGRASDQPCPHVLVPGAGLGRLCLDIAAEGFAAQGNEFSYYMLLGSAFMLNHTAATEQWTIYPWALASCNQLSDAEQLRPVPIPDLLPQQVPGINGLLSMVAGDFVEVYGQEGYSSTFDAVATCFFLDTAHNLFEYIDVIWNVLKEGGLWVNLGPLLYHWADAHSYLPGEELSIELSLDTVVRACHAGGFRTLQSSMVPSVFNGNLRSMLQSSYRCVFWTMEKIAREEQVAAKPGR